MWDVCSKISQIIFNLCSHRIQDFMQAIYLQQQLESSSIPELGYVFVVFLGVDFECSSQDVYIPYHDISSDQSQAGKQAGR